MSSQLFRRKAISDLLPESADTLKRVLGAGDLIMLAIGAVIGAGIFSSIGTAAAGEVLPSGALLRGAGRDDSAGGQRLRLLVRHAR